MREILFRAKRTDNGEWVYGFYTNHCVDHLYIARIERTTFSEYGEPVDYITVDNKTVGQFTGLTDKNGSKIFENDILKGRSNDYPYLVRYEECRFKIEDKWGNRVKMTQEAINWLGVELIGNIHDNPELLKKD